MIFDSVAKAIFITNTFAGAHPEEHLKLWKKFEYEVPVHQRTGPYGADNIAYIKWLKTQKNPIVLSFLKEEINQDTV